MSTVAHKNIVEYLGAKGWNTGVVEIYMNLKEGNLVDMVQRFPESRSDSTILHSLLRQILEALDYLAFRELCHRDVKLENILFTVINNSDCHFQLSDFALANQKDEARTFCGSPVFMAPELVFGTDLQTPKMDVWSLFVTIVSFTTSKFGKGLKSHQEILDRVRKAASDHPKLASMACEDPKLRTSAAELLVKWFNGQGLSTPRRLVGKVRTNDAAPSSQPAPPSNAVPDTAPDAAPDAQSYVQSGVARKRETIKLHEQYRKSAKNTIARRRKRTAPLGPYQQFT